MPGPRDYTRRTIFALAHYSGGLCYWPGCPEPVLRDVNGEPYLIVQIAHIRGAFPGSCRYEGSMTDDQRRDHPNLLLLCDPHHQQVDSREREKTYTVEVLQRWKSLRESDPQSAVKRLREVSPAALKEIVADGMRQRDDRLLSTLDRLETNDREAAVLMRGLVDELTESYSLLRQGIPADILEVFAESVRTMPSSDILELFANAAETLRGMSGTIDGFNTAVYDMRDRRGLGEY